MGEKSLEQRAKEAGVLSMEEHRKKLDAEKLDAEKAEVVGDPDDLEEVDSDGNIVLSDDDLKKAA